jgi:hypothetical protein
VEKESGRNDGDILQNKTRDSNQVARDFHQKEKEKHKAKQEQDKQLKKGIPKYFENCLERCQTLLSSNHINPELYTLPVLYYYSDMCLSINRKAVFEAHILDSSYQSIINSSDEKHHKKAVNNYNKIIENFNGTR